MDRVIGIPYCGNKNSIAEELIKLIQWKEPRKRTFYDLFGGGGSISFEALYQGYNVYYNEINKSIYELQKKLIENGKNEIYSKYGIMPEEWYRFINKAEYDKLKYDETDLAYNGFVNIIYAFGNKWHSNYLYAVDKQGYKKKYHDKIMIDEYWLDKRLEVMKKAKKEEADNRVEHLERMSILERYRQLNLMKNFLKNDIKISNLSYEQVELGKPEESVIICDIPYKQVSQDIYGEKDTFNRADFIKWCQNKAEEGYTIYVCEFEFEIGEEIYRKERYEHISRDNNDTENREEVLFMINKDTKDKLIKLEKPEPMSLFDYLEMGKEE